MSQATANFNLPNREADAGRPMAVRFGDLFGGCFVNIIESNLCKTRWQYRFPRSKKRRVRDRWAKRERNFKYTPTMYRAPENTIYCHPSIAARLRAEFPPNGLPEPSRHDDARKTK